MCYIHAAALISEYMSMVESKSHMPQVCLFINLLFFNKPRLNGCCSKVSIVWHKIHMRPLLSDNSSRNVIRLVQGCIAFSTISPNVLQECAIRDDVLKPDEDGKSSSTALFRCSSFYFEKYNFYVLTRPTK